MYEQEFTGKGQSPCDLNRFPSDGGHVFAYLVSRQPAEDAGHFLDTQSASNLCFQSRSFQSVIYICDTVISQQTLASRKHAM